MQQPVDHLHHQFRRAAAPVARSAGDVHRLVHGGGIGRGGLLRRAVLREHPRAGGDLVGASLGRDRSTAAVELQETGVAACLGLRLGARNRPGVCCPGPKPFWAIKRPAPPYRSATRNRFTVKTAKGA